MNTNFQPVKSPTKLARMGKMRETQNYSYVQNTMFVVLQHCYPEMNIFYAVFLLAA